MAGDELAVVESKLSVPSLPHDVVPSHPHDVVPSSRGVDNTPVASIPVSMVVHGGTGVHHGNMTSLTVNQYIGVVPERGRGAWDSDMVRELVADAVKISADANAQLFHPGEHGSKPSPSGLHKKLAKQGRKKTFWIMLTVLTISLVVLVSVSVYTKFLSSSPPPPSSQPSEISRMSPMQPFHLPTVIPDTEVETSSALPQNDADAPRIFQRSYWLARPAKGVVTRSVLPLERVIVCDTQTEECHTSDECVDDVLNTQRHDMNAAKLQDISFNFMIGGEGNVYVGRGWDLQGAHTKHQNVRSLGVGLIGTFSEVPPNENQLRALARLINTGVDNAKISPNYTLLTHCQLREDGYPGKALALQLSGWPHFDHSYPISQCTK